MSAYPPKHPTETLPDWLDRFTMHTTTNNALKPFPSSGKRGAPTTSLAGYCSSPAGPPSKRAKKTSALSSSSSFSRPIKPDSSHQQQQPATTDDIKDKLTTVMTITTRGPAHNDKTKPKNQQTRAARTVALHVGMLAQKSPFLYRLALTSPGPEIKLLELDSDAFGIFAAWVYSNRVDFDTHGDDAGDILPSVLECYTLATQTLQAPGFANAVLRCACEVSATDGLVFRNGVITEMYKRTPRGCALRRWIVDEWVWQFDNEAVGSGELEWEGNGDLCNGFLFEVMVAQARRLGRKAMEHQSPGKMVERYCEL
ncbi:hypothetical protein LTR36_006107 [Oleoguttula mirabilis]|uniref:BTB domain-containing protein n=1 Tax=Oleoguttula mirabilis TaxID=1507867 RepID=A0AAV9JDQ2_9PEZI|nr:hypothetical protein LTR36_006107 [Oleoguttula mirabilis]